MTEKFVNRHRFPELTVSGSPSDIGHQIGEHFYSEINEITELVIERFNKSNPSPVTWAEAEKIASQSFSLAGVFFPDIISEINATSEAAGVPVERLMVLNTRNMLGFANEGCTSILVDAKASTTGTGFAAQNWDNDPVMGSLSAVITRKGTGKPVFMSWMQPGLVAYMGINSVGTGICMNALNGPSDTKGIPWYFLVRAILEAESQKSAVTQVTSVPRSLTANAAIITSQGPLNLEITPSSVEAVKFDQNGIFVHTNHCVHPGLQENNDKYADRIYGQSYERLERGKALLSDLSGLNGVSPNDAKTVLSDHLGYPTSICRHPNNDIATGWQRSVISIILEPALDVIQISNGNPCNNAYETYRMN